MGEEWGNDYIMKLDSRAAELRCSLEMADYIFKLEDRLARLESQLD